jgi:hypothetical protein
MRAQRDASLYTAIRMLPHPIPMCLALHLCILSSLLKSHSLVRADQLPSHSGSFATCTGLGAKQLHRSQLMKARSFMPAELVTDVGFSNGAMTDQLVCLRIPYHSSQL